MGELLFQGNYNIRCDLDENLYASDYESEALTTAIQLHNLGNNSKVND